jgi:biopolymer transport protein ExbB/TolQ
MHTDKTIPTLAFSTGDPERQFGLPAGRFTSPNSLIALFLAGTMTVSVFSAAAFAPDWAVSRSLTERGWVPYAIVFGAAWALALLFVKQRKLAFQRKALAIQIVPSDPMFVLSPAAAAELLEHMYDHVDDPRRFVLFNRIQLALANLRNMRQIGDVREVLDAQAETDEANMDSSYTVVRGLIWAVPVLGFIGTVLGLSIAIGSFGEVLASGSDISTLRPALENVTAGLGVAFETTLQGLLAALAIHLLMTFIHQSEERFLENCREYCQRNIVGRLRLSESGGI